MAVSVQAVSAAIRTTDNVIVSKRYTHKGSSSVRSCGVYTEKKYDDRIVLAYWTGGYNHHVERAAVQLPLVIETLKSKGFDVIERQETSFSGVGKTYLEVVEA